VFVSLTVILGAGLIALIVDYLKGSNEQLRERNIELSVRREEESRRSISEIRLLRERMLSAAGVAAAASASREPESARPTQAIMEKAVERAVRHASAEKSADTPRRLEVVSRKSAVESPVEVVRPAAPPAPRVERIALAAKPTTPAEAAEPAMVVLVTPLEEPRAPETVTVVRPELVKPVTVLPQGFFEAAEVATLVGDSQSVTGVVVAIGIKDYQWILQSQSKSGALDLVDSVGRMLRSMISPNDFAFRRSEDEFIIVFPNEKGAAAQKRINQVAEQLWDFQLRWLAAFSALISWGAVAVVEQSFSDAVELAAYEMSENRGSRHSRGLDNLRAHRRAANS
jgi:hypothetical protein